MVAPAYTTTSSSNVGWRLLGTTEHSSVGIGRQRSGAQRHLLVEAAAITDFGRLPDHHPGAMVDEASGPDLGARMNIDARFRVRHLGQHSGQHPRLTKMQLMGESVHRDGLDPGVTQPRFRRTGHGRVASLRRFQIARQHGPEPGNGKHDCVFQHGVGAGETTQGGPQANPQQIKGLLPGTVSGLPKRDPLQRAREQQGQYRVQHASRFGRGRARIPGLAAGKFVPIVQWVVGRHAGGIVRLLVVGWIAHG